MNGSLRERREYGVGRLDVYVICTDPCFTPLSKACLIILHDHEGPVHANASEGDDSILRLVFPQYPELVHVAFSQAAKLSSFSYVAH